MSGECDMLSEIQRAKKGEERGNRWRGGVVDVEVEITSNDEVGRGGGEIFKEGREFIAKIRFRERGRTVNSEEGVR